ncbi:hypothetical protein ACF061_12925 [Streptomyces sp. NPDC015220]|uniref:hypothetical protein n=1 Tax=Streptomyces sp. NPDC015220 TaxID=3364947 RepID=UPI0036FBFE21
MQQVLGRYRCCDHLASAELVAVPAFWAAVPDLLASDRLPGQQACTARMLADAPAGRPRRLGRAPPAVTTVRCGRDGGINGVVSCTERPSDATSVILRQHCAEPPKQRRP